MCVSENGSDGLCTDGTALTGASSVTIAPDGSQVFVTAARDRRGHGLRARRRDRPPDAAELPARPGAAGWVVQGRAGAGGRGGERDQPRRQDAVRGQRGRRGARAVRPRRGDRRADPVVVLRAPGGGPRTSMRKPRRTRRRRTPRPATARPRWRSAGRARWSCRPTGAACSCSATRTTSPTFGRDPGSGTAHADRLRGGRGHLPGVLAGPRAVRRARHGGLLRRAVAVRRQPVGARGLGARRQRGGREPRRRGRPPRALPRPARLPRRARARLRRRPARRRHEDARLPRARGRLARRAGAAAEAAAPRRAQARARAGERWRRATRGG